MQYRTVPVSSIKVGERYRKDMGDLPSLAASIKIRGQLQPIIVDSQMNLAAGERRLRAIQMLGWDTIEVKVVDLDSLLIEHDENEFRKDFTVSERVAIGKAIEEKIVRSRAANGSYVSNPELNGNRADDVIAKATGFGNRQTYRQAVDVVENGVDEVVSAMDSEVISISDASKIIDAAPNMQRAAIKDVKNGKAKTAAEALRERNSQRDKSGKLWPRNVLPAIEANHELNDFRSTISKMIDKAVGLSSGPMKTHIDWQPIVDALEKVRTTCMKGKPDYICPYCSGNGQTGDRGACKKCKGSGWVPSRIWAQSPSGHDSLDE